MNREKLLAVARRHLWAAWSLSSEEIGSQAADTLYGLGMLVPEGGAQELERLRDRVAELERCQKNQADNFETQAALIRQAEARVAELEQLLVEERPSDEDPIAYELTELADEEVRVTRSTAKLRGILAGQRDAVATEGGEAR